MTPFARALEKPDAPRAAQVVAALKITSATVAEWRSGRRHVPIARCAQLERMFPGRFDRRDLRPNDWHLIWPELIGPEGAPAVPAQALAQPGPAEPVVQPIVAQEGA